jgi:S-adenosylmethionine synthetase
MIKIERLSHFEENDLEIVERKGLGHPDTICDSLAEEFSRELSKLYLERFGRILHHNVDKAILVGGVAKPRFGGGEVIEPIIFSLVGRVTNFYKGQNLDREIGELFYRTVEGWIKENIPNLDPKRHIRADIIARPGSVDLVDLFERNGNIPLANDTSFGVGFYPLSKAEKIALEVERFLNSKNYKFKHPEVGEDIKVMVVRNGEEFNVTVALAFVDKYISSLKEYLEKKGEIKGDVEDLVKGILDGEEAKVHINTADDEGSGSVYITVTGTSAEAGDDGQVGRGNRVNGLITPYRPMTLEAAAGKNPISHVGKLYNIAANEIAREIYEKFSSYGIKQVYLYLVSQIGKPINQPQLTHIKIWGDFEEKVEREIFDLVRERIDQLPKLWERIVFEGLGVC